MPPSNPARSRAPRPRAIPAILALLSAILVTPAPARADLVGPMEMSCRGLKEGDPCDESNEGLGKPAYRGACVRRHFAEGRDRLYCRPEGPPLTPLQEACIDETEGATCTRPTGAEGKCTPASTRAVQGWNGKGTVELPLYECIRVAPDRSAETRTGLLMVISAFLAIAGLVVYLRRRAAKKVEPPISRRS